MLFLFQKKNINLNHPVMSLNRLVQSGSNTYILHGAKTFKKFLNSQLYARLSDSWLKMATEARRYSRGSSYFGTSSAPKSLTKKCTGWEKLRHFRDSTAGKLKWIETYREKVKWIEPCREKVKWIETRRENDYLTNMLTFHIILNKTILWTPQSILERAIKVSALDKPIFLKTCLNGKIPADGKTACPVNECRMFSYQETTYHYVSLTQSYLLVFFTQALPLIHLSNLLEQLLHSDSSYY